MVCASKLQFEMARDIVKSMKTTHVGIFMSGASLVSPPFLFLNTTPKTGWSEILYFASQVASEICNARVSLKSSYVKLNTYKHDIHKL